MLVLEFDAQFQLGGVFVFLQFVDPFAVIS
jgi:hypothetical protein